MNLPDPQDDDRPVIAALVVTPNRRDKLKTTVQRLLAEAVERGLGLRDVSDRIDDDRRPCATAGPEFVAVSWPEIVALTR